MKHFISGVFILIFSGCFILPEPDFSPVESNLKVITYNVNWGGAYPYRIVEYIKKSNADIIFLQETHKQWENYLVKHLSYRYKYNVFKESPGAGGIAFMSRFKIKNIRLINPEAGWFPALKAEVETPLGVVQVINVHLRPPLSERGSPTLSALYNSSRIHKKELDHFLKGTLSDVPLIIAGDFNEDEKGKAVINLIKNGFTDSLSIYDSSSNTWKWKVFSGFTLKGRYDHILYNKFFHCTGASVTNVNASDHMPVLAVLVSRQPGSE